MFRWALGFCALSVAASLVGSASGQYQIREWSGAQGGYTIDAQSKAVTVWAEGTYKFQATDGNELAEIHSIYVEDTASTVKITVARDPNEGGGPGCTELGTPLTRSPAHPLTRSPAHPLTRSPAHPLTRGTAEPVGGGLAGCGSLEFVVKPVSRPGRMRYEPVDLGRRAEPSRVR